jgi:hypothetical protein
VLLFIHKKYTGIAPEVHGCRFCTALPYATGPYALCEFTSNTATGRGGRGAEITLHARKGIVLYSIYSRGDDGASLTSLPDPRLDAKKQKPVVLQGGRPNNGTVRGRGL